MKEFKTRKPTGKPNYPLILLAGIQGAGKTWAAVEATRMESVDRSFFIEIGESTADTYGAIAGADFEIIEHNGTLGNIREAVEWATAQPAAEGKYNLLIIDSLTEFWGLVCDNAQQVANQRQARKRYKNKNADAEAPISQDLWNKAGDTYKGLLSQLRRFNGLVIATARLELVTAMENGKPTTMKEWKIKAQKTTPFDFQFIFQAREPRQWVMTKSVTTIPELQLQPYGEMQLQDFSVSKLVETLGIEAHNTPHTHVDLRANGELSDNLPQQQPRQVQQRPPQQQRRPDGIPNKDGLDRAGTVKAFADMLGQHEQAGNLEGLKKLEGYAVQFNDRELIHMAQKIVSRFESKAKAEANTMQQAQQVAQQVLDAEIVE